MGEIFIDTMDEADALPTPKKPKLKRNLSKSLLLKRSLDRSSSSQFGKRKLSLTGVGGSLNEEVGGTESFRNLLCAISPRNEKRDDKSRNPTGDVKFEENTKIATLDETEKERALRHQKVTSTISELIETERTYLQDLDVMIHKIMKPMAEKKDFLTGEPLVSPQDIQKIWSNISLLPTVNKALLQDLEVVAQAEGDNRQLKVAEAFQNVADFMKIYADFCSNQPVSSATVQKLLNSSQFEAFLAEKADVSVMKESRNLDLNAFLIKPVQRICKYPLFLRDLLLVTPYDHASFMPLTDAASKIDAVVSSINDTKKKAENNLKVAEIASRITELPFPLLIPGRLIILQGEFKKISTGKKWQKGALFVFSDIFLITKTVRKSKLKYIAHYNMKFLDVSVQKEKEGI